MGSRNKSSGAHPVFLTGEHEVVDLTDSTELPSEMIDKYNRSFESGIHTAVVRTDRTRKPSRRGKGKSRVKVDTSSSASDGWAAKWMRIANKNDQKKR